MFPELVLCEVSVRQINLQKCRAATVELGRKESDHIQLITEPYTIKSRVSLLNNTLGHSWSTRSGKPRAAIWCNNQLCPWMVERFTNEDICVIAFKMNGRTVYCAAVYLDNNLTVRLRKFVQLLEFCDSKRIPLIVGADSNAHSVLWGCEETNKRGEELEELILRFNLNVANTAGEYTFSTSRANSIIDITLVNPPTSNSFFPKNWRVLSEESFSDHKYLAFELGEFDEEIRLTRKLKGVDWQKFTEGMDAAFSSFEESDSLETDVNCFYALLYEQLDIIAPRRACKPREGSHWCTPKLSSMREELKHLLEHKRNPVMADKLRQVKRSYSSLTRKERSNSCGVSARRRKQQRRSALWCK